MIATILFIAALIWAAGSLAILAWAMTRPRAWWSNLIWAERGGLAAVILLWPIAGVCILAVAAHAWWRYR